MCLQLLRYVLSYILYKIYIFPRQKTLYQLILKQECPNPVDHHPVSPTPLFLHQFPEDIHSYESRQRTLTILTQIWMYNLIKESERCHVSVL